MKELIRSEVKQEVQALVTNIAFSNIPSWYGSTRRDLHMDLIIPKVREGHAPCPCIVWICGGAFLVVDRSIWLPEMLRYARAGYVVASVEYRTSNETPFPAGLIDCKAAVRYLRAYAADYCIDPDHIFAMGESAGGTLASLLGTTGGRKEFEEGQYLEYDSSVQGVVDIYGLADLRPEAIVPSAENADVPADDVPNWAMDAFVGTRFTAESGKRASAIEFVDEKTPPFFILHGTKDPVVPIGQSDRMYEVLQAHGVDATYLQVEGASHGDPMFYQDAICERIVEFLNRIAHKS